MDEIQKTEKRNERRSSVHEVFGWILDGLDDSHTSRVDGPHAPKTSELHAESVEEPNSEEAPVPDNLGSHISPLLGELQNRIDELNQKEQLVYSRLAQVDQERRKVRLWAQELERELEEREQRLLGFEKQLAGEVDASVEHSEADAQIPLVDERNAGRNSQPSIRDLIQQPVVEQLAALLVLTQKFVQENTRLSALASGKVEAVELDLLKQKQQEFHEEADGRQKELDQRERTLEKRARFQQSHLEKLRHQIEDAQDRFRLELQQARTWIENDRTRNRQVAGQLRKFRLLLDEREESLVREQAAIREVRLSSEKEIEQQKDVLKQQQDLEKADLEIRAGQVEHREEVLSQLSAEIEARKEEARVLEQQVQDLYKKNIEMRSTIEAAWNELIAHTDLESARDYVGRSQDSARQDTEQLLGMLEERELAIEEARIRTRSLQDRFELTIAEQQKWYVEESESLQSRLGDLHELLGQIQAEKNNTTETYESWQQQKLQAEKVIRELLSRLEEQGAQ